MLRILIRYCWLKSDVPKLPDFRRFMHCLTPGLTYLQDERERMVVRRFKFEEPRIEQIQDLEVGPV